MAYCPKCAGEIAPDAAVCAHCGTMFGADAAWSPLEHPGREPQPRPISGFGRVMAVVGKLACAAISGAFLFLGAAMAYSEHRANSWFVACTSAGIAVVAVALFARLRWSLLLMLAAVPLGFVSCAANFKWHGG